MEVLRKKVRGKKKQKPSFESEDVEAGSSSAAPLESPVNADDDGLSNFDQKHKTNRTMAAAGYGSTETTENSSNLPSAPPLPEGEEDSLVEDRRQLMRRIFLLLTGQMTWFASLATLFVYIPHLRKIFRVNFFDKLFLTSILGYPLAILAGGALLFFPGLRRRFAWPTLIILTACLSMLVSYVMTVGNADAFMMSVVMSDACSLTAASTSYLPTNIDLTSKAGLVFFPLFMTASNALYPLAFHEMSYKDVIAPSIVTTALMTHIGYNARSVLRDRKLNLKPSEYAFGVSQLYLGFNLYDAVKRTFMRGSRTAAEAPPGYVRI